MLAQLLEYMGEYKKNCLQYKNVTKNLLFLTGIDLTNNSENSNSNTGPKVLIAHEV